MNGEDDYDRWAFLESQALDRGDLQSEAQRNAHNRSETFKNNINNAMTILFWLAILVISIMFVSWAWHLLTPLELHYLKEAQIEKIETMLFSGALAGVVPVFAKKYI